MGESLASPVSADTKATTAGNFNKTMRDANMNTSGRGSPDVGVHKTQTMRGKSAKNPGLGARQYQTERG